MCNFYVWSALCTQCSHISDLIVPPLCLQLLCRIFKLVQFIHVEENGKISLPFSEPGNNKPEITVLLVDMHFTWKYKECVHVWDLERASRKKNKTKSLATEWHAYSMHG